jgi:hypothetical protein
MPRGRHRHSQPLHRLLPPLTVAGCAAALAAACAFTGDTAVLRVVTVATAITAGVGAVLARSWDRSAGRRVAELAAARVRDEWHTDERVAELETDLEEFREIRGRLEKKLRSKRAELARLRTEHADLLRRYATAESERARALEARRRLQLEGAAAQRPLALTSGTSAVGRAAFLKADQALRDLSRNAARQQAQATVEHARRREAVAPEESQGRHSAAAGPVTPALPLREHRLLPAPSAAAAVLPYAQPAAGRHPAGHRAIGGFDFFGTHKAHAGEHVAGPAAEQEQPAGHEQAAQTAIGAEVIDLTAHDDTEQLDMTELRRAKA